MEGGRERILYGVKMVGGRILWEGGRGKEGREGRKML